MAIYPFLEDFILFLKGEKNEILFSDNFVALRTENGEILRKYSDIYAYYLSVKGMIKSPRYKKEDSHYLLFYKVKGIEYISKIKVDSNLKIISILIEKYDREKMKVVLLISYDGSAYFGMQKQNNNPTIQGAIEEALSNMLKRKVPITISSRTDRGVHALGQVVEFLSYGISAKSYKYALNYLLKEDIRVLKAYNRSQVFNCRYDTVKKEYLYIVDTGKYDIFRNNYCYFHKIDDIEAIKEELKSLVGTHDFKAFCKGEKDNTVRTIYEASVKKSGSKYIFTFKGDGFLHNMIRFIVGALIEIDEKKMESIKEIIDSKNKRLTYKIAPAGGLYLKKIDY